MGHAVCASSLVSLVLPIPTPISLIDGDRFLRGVGSVDEGNDLEVTFGDIKGGLRVDGMGRDSEDWGMLERGTPQS